MNDNQRVFVFGRRACSFDQGLGDSRSEEMTWSIVPDVPQAQDHIIEANERGEHTMVVSDGANTKDTFS